jgi:hypothetical protein
MQDDLPDATEHRQVMRYAFIEAYLRETTHKARLMALARLVRYDSSRPDGHRIQTLVKYAEHMEDIARDMD